MDKLSSIHRVKAEIEKLERILEDIPLKEELNRSHINGLIEEARQILNTLKLK